MITPFIIDDKYTLCFNDKSKKLDSIFIWDIKLNKTPVLLRKCSSDLYLYSLIKTWLTTDEPDSKVYTYFLRYMYFIEEKIPIDKMLKYIKDIDDKILLINYFYNLMTK